MIWREVYVWKAQSLWGNCWNGAEPTEMSWEEIARALHPRLPPEANTTILPPREAWEWGGPVCGVWVWGLKCRIFSLPSSIARATSIPNRDKREPYFERAPPLSFPLSLPLPPLMYSPPWSEAFLNIKKRSSKKAYSYNLLKCAHFNLWITEAPNYPQTNTLSLFKESS